MDNLKPTQIMLIAGGAVLLISTFLAWSDFGVATFNGWETDVWGFQGIFVAIIGVAIAGGVAAQAFGGVTLPEKILGLDHNQLHLMLGFGAFLITFGRQFGDSPGIGVLLGWIASAVIIAAAIMDSREAEAGTPSQF
ncbi:MAG: hypothetical protein AAF081_11715 [Actinomycetota bacterium]